MKNNPRMTRINDEIMRETAEIIRSEIKDPRVSAMVTVTKVETSSDLTHSKIHISIMGDSKQKEDALEGIKNAAGFIRKLIAERVNLRNTPALNFVLDESLEYGMRISKLMDEINKGGSI